MTDLQVDSGGNWEICSTKLSLAPLRMATSPWSGLHTAHEDFQQCGLAGTVGPDQADALAFGDSEGDIFEERGEAVTFRQFLSVDDGRQKFQSSPVNSLTFRIPVESFADRIIREIWKTHGRENNSQI